MRLLNCDEESLMTRGCPELADELIRELPAGLPFIRIIFGVELPSCFICTVCSLGVVETMVFLGEVSLKSLFPASVRDNV